MQSLPTYGWRFALFSPEDCADRHLFCWRQKYVEERVFCHMADGQPRLVAGPLKGRSSLARDHDADEVVLLYRFLVATKCAAW